MRHLNISSLSSFMDKNDVMFIYKIVNSHIDCSDLLNRLKFYVLSRNLRATPKYFFIPLLSQEYLYRSPIYRCSNLCNGNIDWLDLYNS